MQTRLGKTRVTPKRQPACTEVRVPSKKRHASAIDCPQNQGHPQPLKKQKTSKAVHFEQHAEREHEIPRYKGPFTDDSLISEKNSASSGNDSAPSEELLRKMSLELDEFLADSDDEDEDEDDEDETDAQYLDELESCDMSTEEDLGDDEPIAEYLEEMEKLTIMSLMRDIRSEERRAEHMSKKRDPTVANTHKDIAVESITTPSTPPKTPKNKDSDFKQRYLSLKTAAWNWSSTHFPPPDPASPLNLLDLCYASPQLMEYANYITTRTSTTTWEDIFTKQRAFLVYCILGKVLEVHVFGHEMFGGSEEEVDILRAADERGMMGDFITRQSTRASLISAFLSHPSPSHHHPNPNPYRTTLPTNALPHLTDLTSSLLTLFSPLLPTPNSPSTTQNLTNTLSALLLTASTLSLSLRLEPQTLYNWHTHPAPGTFYSRSDMHILDRSNSPAREEGEERVVNMSGWPSLVAYSQSHGDDDNDNDAENTNSDAEDEDTEEGKAAGGLDIRLLARAEVLIEWSPSSPMGGVRDCLRDEMIARDQERKGRKVVVRSGWAVGASLAVGWALQQPWVAGRVRGLVLGG